MKNLLPVILCSTFTVPAFAGVTISNPYNGDHVTSPFSLTAYASTCSDEPVSSMAYSLDSGGDLDIVHDTSMDVKVSSGTGSHTVHVKAWGDNGASCVTDVTVSVTATSDDAGVSDASLAPSNASHNSNLQALHGWREAHDKGTSGSSSGSTKIVGSPSHGGNTREFAFSYRDRGGERYSVSFGDDPSATNFLYDAWVYVTDSASHVANLEMDLNQTMPNGETAIFGVQCDGYSGTWDYSENLGSPHHPKGHWAHSGAHCDVRSWSKNKWHHVQIAYSRNSTGKATYKYVIFDGHKSNLNHTVLVARALGWASTLLTNFQVDGLGSEGSIKLYLDDLTISRW